MTEHADLTNHFLIAMPGLMDSNFRRTVTYICEHNESGAMGIVLNRPTELQLKDILEQLEIESRDPQQADRTIYVGGPVQTERGFVLHADDSDWDSTLHIAPGISVTTSRDILEALAQGSGPKSTLIALGYAGWQGGQLEDELASNAWLSGPADKQIIFELPANQRLQAAASLLGVDLNLIPGMPGHA